MMAPHPSLLAASKLVMGLGIANLMIPFLTCVLIAGTYGAYSVPIDDLATWLFCGLEILVFMIPGVALMVCSGPIGRGRKSAVTVALVLCSLMVLIYLLTLVQYVGQLIIYARWRDQLPPPRIFVSLMVIVVLFGGFIMGIVKLAKCYGVISLFVLDGHRGFEPVLPHAPPDQSLPPPDGDWPDITQ